MNLMDQIQEQLEELPPEKQAEVLDFTMFLKQRLAKAKSVPFCSLKQHPAFGLWRDKKIDALRYQQDLRAEWDRQT